MFQHRTPSQPLSQLLKQRPLQAVPTGVHSLDLSLHGGLVPGQLYEISGLNNTGKSTLAAQLCLSAIKQDKRVLWITMMQALPINALLQLDPLLDLDAPHTQLTHHRITSTAALFMFLMQLPTQYGLIIIEDFALAVNRSIGELDDLIDKPKVSLEARRTKTILDFIKCINFYCGKSKASCAFFNPVDTMNMSFIEVDSSISSTQSMSSSQSFNSTRPRPKRINQQVLVSALGDNSTWNSMFRARILLYKDWSLGERKSATFANIKHSPAMRRVLQAKGIQQRVVHFHVTKEGLKDAKIPDELCDVDQSRHEFTLDEKDLESDYDDDDSKETTEAQEEATAEKDNIIPSSPCRDIQNARELLTSQMQEDLFKNLEEPDTKPASQEENSTAEISDTAALLLAEEKEVEEPQVNVEVDTVIEATEAEHNHPNLHEEEEEETDDEKGPTIEEHEKQPTEIVEELRIASMMSDKSFEIQEIDDELEELYPTQPEAINIVRLSQLQMRAESFKRSKTSPDTSSKRLKIVGEESQEMEDTIPATFPFF